MLIRNKNKNILIKIRDKYFIFKEQEYINKELGKKYISNQNKIIQYITDIISTFRIWSDSVVY